jgi:hypothetical protein
MTPGFAYAACIKRAAAYEPGNDTVVRNSYIHDNAWAGIWCDFCKHGLLDIEGNRIERNGSYGVQWEMSGGWSASDRAVVRNNVIRGNNRLGNPQRGGLGISTANDIIVESNDFGGNAGAGVVIRFSLSRDPPQTGSSGVVVRDNAMRDDAIVGCGSVSLAHRISYYRTQFGPVPLAAGALLIVAALLLLRLVGRARVPTVIGLALFAVLVVAFVSALPQPAGAICLSNG